MGARTGTSCRPSRTRRRSGRKRRRRQPRRRGTRRSWRRRTRRRPATLSCKASSFAMARRKRRRRLGSSRGKVAAPRSARWRRIAASPQTAWRWATTATRSRASAASLVHALQGDPMWAEGMCGSRVQMLVTCRLKLLPRARWTARTTALSKVCRFHTLPPHPQHSNWWQQTKSALESETVHA